MLDHDYNWYYSSSNSRKPVPVGSFLIDSGKPSCAYGRAHEGGVGEERGRERGREVGREVER